MDRRTKIQRDRETERQRERQRGRERERKYAQNKSDRKSLLSKFLLRFQMLS